MKTKAFYRIIFIILVIILSMFLINSISFADNFDFSGFENQNASTKITTPIKEIVGGILGAIRIIGTGVALIIVSYIGIKYMISSPGERADFKKAAIQYVVGAVIVFSASNILGILEPIITRIFPA
jgi:type IV secretory pathway VirB2 component (pilin)